MLIEIRGTGFVNKGAELMLRSIISMLREKGPSAALAVSPVGVNSDYLQRSELGLYQKLWLQRYGLQWGDLAAIVPRVIRQRYGVVLDSEVDVVLDASGFSYTDQWGPRLTIDAAKSIKRWKKQGAKVIFMPQAFGPFKGEKIKSAFKVLVENADLMFARDQVSYEHITQLVGQHDHIKIAPDFTCLIEGQVPENFDAKVNNFCIIPNYRMIDMTSEVQSNSYLTFLIKCTQYLFEKGANPFILIHEGEKDLWLGREIAKGVGRDINIVQESNALCIKGIIGASDGVISSRFHGLVSALSQGIPALATGWSHKYQMLFKEYGFGEGLIDVTVDDEVIFQKIDLIIDSVSRKRIKTVLEKNSKMLKCRSEQMWQDVFQTIEV